MESQGGTDPHKALVNPIRKMILEAIQEQGTSSPTRFTQGKKDTDGEVDMKIVAYHFHVLNRMEVIEIADKIHRRGAIECTYRINPKSPVPDTMRASQLLERLADATDDGQSGENLAGGSGGFPSQILSVEVDQQGQVELHQFMASIKAGLRELEQECRRRLADSPAEPISMRIGLATFQPGSDGTTPPAST
jgi:hypothetical protein